MARRPRHPPFSIRLTPEERATLERAAGCISLNAYIRSRILDGAPAPSPRMRMPVRDHVFLGRVLGELGKSRLSQNLNQLAHAANSGSLPVSPETEAALQEACDDVRRMRADLMRALGLSPG